MNKKILFTIIVATLAFFMTSCMTMQVAKVESTRTSTFRTLDISTAAVTADLKINQTKSTGNAKDRVGANLESIKSTAIRDLLEQNDGDILLEPSYVVVNDGSYITVSVSGYVGKYTNLRQVSGSAAQIKVVHPGEAVKTETSATSTPAKSKGMLGLGIGGL